VKRFEEFVHRRINPDLFDSPETIREAILLAGGSPRELLRILSYANMYADEDINVIKREDMNKGAQKLANITAQYISENDFELLKVLKESNQSGRYIPFDDKWQDLLEKLIILEYNDGTYKRVNPVVELSPLYKQHVG
jgi:oligoendopeptidase F